ncbi:MAG TPA: cell division protein SepF [Cyanobacteria bacterium UBA11149]|nr:cell division protein SepF [Cyanobacteria bacterium UBA11367]HBE56003.1 cell division protein SepF [Cyanobacteria bacterium UBA11366]HBK66121.1 cell division protein SepF [Cyanobacteria bacterium UBA11166]HBR74063.1 cell division protein SepF [Cyanobacteria bacterium UBA11159]HBS67727.1 cell division protein SepF [Cyanobacteria bacterium UBA11153]HBW91604.1 cell division protein SepF [Cyanobacteria bacterium UBA11149]HCA95757.1 cell division protein SepF [Cyanobacteria bacterium UBA9226]
MNNLFTKLRDFVGFNDPPEYDEEYYDDPDTYPNNYQPEQPPAAPPPEEERQPRRRVRERTVGSESGMGSSSMNNVIGMPGSVNGVAEVAVIEPRSFEEMPQVIQALRERKSVVLNLTMMDPDQAQRAVDFVAGGTYAIDGHQERIGESIFLFTPSCVQVSTQSGVVHEVPSSQPRTSRPAAPSPAWASEAERMAQ